MKIRQAGWAAILLMALHFRAQAATLYVYVNSTNPVPPYVRWNTAATNIQDAVDASTNGDLILVTNGVYQSGGRVSIDGATNCVVVTNAITLESVNGAASTLIDGRQLMRCVYLADGSTLAGITATNGNVGSSANGGGVFCTSTNVLISNCVLVRNTAQSGGGAWLGTLENCLVSTNSAYSGGGVCSNTLNNCTVEYNSAATGGGAFYCALVNCTIVSNSAFGGGGAASSTLINCTIAGNRGNNIAGGVSSCTLSNCLLTGNSDDGAYRSILNNCTLSNNIARTYAGGAQQSILSNCMVCNNQGGQDGGGVYDCFINFCTISNNVGGYGGGVYDDATDTNGLGGGNVIVGNMAAIGGGVYFGRNTNLNGWMFISNSATSDGGGLYQTSQSTTLNNCTFLGNASGGRGGGVCNPSPYLASASNCTFTGNIAKGSGGGAYNFSLTNCSLIGNKAGDGGGLLGIPYNCVFSDNIATNEGGGLYCDNGLPPLPMVMNCAFTNNSASGGGGAYSAGSYYFSNCVFWANSGTNNGGGIYGGSLVYCIVSYNTTGGNGGGAYLAQTITDCLFYDNSAGTNGGGIYATQNFPAIVSSTIASNRAVMAGGGIYSPGPFGGVTNCIIYDNVAAANMNYSTPATSQYHYCCTTPLPAALPNQNNHNITNDPALADLVDGNFHLQSNSPCINSGNNAYVTSTTDLDGNPRIVAGTVDIGAYEYQTPVSQISYAWLQQYGLPISSNTDTADPDGDRMNNYQEWIAGTNPTNALSVLLMLPPVPTNNPSGLILGWESVSNRTYFLQSSTNLGAQPAFSTIQSNIVGQAGTTGYMDTNAVGNSPYFYRVGVQ